MHLGLATLGTLTLFGAIAPGANAYFAYVANQDEANVSVINTQTNQVVSRSGGIPVGHDPEAIAITPDGRFAYVAVRGDNSVSVINTQTNQVVSGLEGLKAGNCHLALRSPPDQPPSAAFIVPRVRPGVPASLDASSSKPAKNKHSLLANRLNNRPQIRVRKEQVNELCHADVVHRDRRIFGRSND